METFILVLKNLAKLFVSLIIVGALVFGVIKIYSVITADDNPVEKEELAEKERDESSILAVETVKGYLAKAGVKADTVETTTSISKTGTILAGQQVTVSPEITANIKELKVSEGALVKKGDLLATLENSSQLQNAVVSYNSAASLLRNAEQLLTITARSGDVSLSTFQEQFAQAQINIDKAAIQLESAQAIRYRQFEVADINSATAKLQALQTQANAVLAETAKTEEMQESASTEQDYYTKFLQNTMQNVVENNQDAAAIKSRDLEILQGRVQDDTNYLSLESSQIQLSLLSKQMQSTELQNQASIVNARNQVIQIRQQIDSAKISLSLGEIRSPINGVVANLNITAGSRVNPGQELFTVVNFDEIKIKLFLSPAELQTIATNSKSNIDTVVEVLGTELKANINYLGLVANAQTRTIPVEVSPIFESYNQKSKFIPNSFAKVKFNLVSTSKVTNSDVVASDTGFKLPLSALVKGTNNKLSVAVIDKGLVAYKEVELTPNIKSGKVEIAKGINDGEEIILNPTDLKQGLKVTTK
jgi:RND family efflux transporter MFP subunit